METRNLTTTLCLSATLSLSVLLPMTGYAQTSAGHEKIVTAPNGRKFVVEDPAEFQQRMTELLEERRASSNNGRILHPLFTPPAYYSLAAYQTPIRDQLDRGSCWAFCGVAALEAAYKRQYGLNLDLSEQYVFSVGKTFELYPDYVTSALNHENNSTFYGGQGSSDVLEKMRRAAVPLENYAPYKSQSQLDAMRKAVIGSAALDWNSTQEQYDAFEYSEQNIPRAARANAKYQVTGWSMTPDVSTDTLEKTISANHEVAIDITVKWKWVPAINALDYDPDPANTGGGHCLLLVGYDRTKQIFIAKNSWGGSTLTNLTYNFIKKACFSGAYILGIGNPANAPQAKANWIGKWNMDHDGWRETLVMRRFTDFHTGENAQTKLGNLYRDGKRYDVNGYFTDGGRGVVFYVADTTNRIAPGTLTGQYFHPYGFSWDTNNAAGFTYWNGISFGVTISRDALPFYSSSGFNLNNWIGTYNMNHDGWRGTLYITGYYYSGGWPILNVFYRFSDGNWLPVSGYMDKSDPHKVTLNITFGANTQKFDLDYHTWEKGIFSGQTYWSTSTYGVQGFKQ